MIRRTGILHHFAHPGPMPKAPPLARSDVRASEGAIRSQTGKSGPVSVPHHHHHHYSAVGDHRQGMHTGSANASKAPRIDAGRAAVFGRNGNGGDNG
jgi:hypothetical protein